MRTSQRIRWSAIVAITAFVCVACGATNVSSDNRIATRVAEELAIVQTLTAVAVTAQGAQEFATTQVVVVVPTTTPQFVVETPTTPASPTPTPTDTPDERVVYQDSRPEGTITPGSPIQDDNGNPVEGVTITGGISIANVTGEQDGLLIAGDQLAIRVDAQLNGGSYDPATNNGIRQVEIIIERMNDDGSQGAEVHRQTEKNWPYCSFSDADSQCTLWVFAEQGDQWPNGEPFEDGQYQVSARISLNDYELTQPFWFSRFYIQRS